MIKTRCIVGMESTERAKAYYILQTQSSKWRTAHTIPLSKQTPSLEPPKRKSQTMQGLLENLTFIDHYSPILYFDFLLLFCFK